MIYFNDKKEAFAYKIQDPLCVIEDSLWKKYYSTDKWDIINGEFIDISDTEEYRKKKEEERKEYILSLKCTKRVLALALKEFGITYTQLKDLIDSDEDAQLEWDLCVELQRSNPLLDKFGERLGITPEQIDNIFLYANGDIESLGV